MQELFSGDLRIDHGYAFIGPDGAYTEGPLPGEQVNGLLGISIPDTLHMSFGLHTGEVHLSIRVAGTAPELEDQWEEVVEVPFLLQKPHPDDLADDLDYENIGLTTFGGRQPLALKQGAYRVRYCAKNMGAAEGAPNYRDANGQCIERYELTFWPAPWQEGQEDEIVKVTSERAAAFHKNLEVT